MGYIYLRTNKINGKQYVGLTTDLKTRQRKWNNLSYRYAGPVIDKARAKYGIDVFDFEILKECEDDELNKWETYYIKELNTKVPYGYNLTDGGEGMTGYTHSEETRKKLSEARKGKEPWIKGKHLSEETRKKISEAMKGKNNHNYGKHTEETKRKIGEALKGVFNTKSSKPLLQLDKVTGEVIREWPSAMEVHRQLGYSHAHISDCCNGKRKTTGGFKWQYK